MVWFWTIQPMKSPKQSTTSAKEETANRETGKMGRGTMSRQLAKWWEDSESECVGQYRRDSTGSVVKRARVIADGRAGDFYGIGSTPEEADAALRTFTNPECVCFPGEEHACKIHPDVKIQELEENRDSGRGPALECRFSGFDTDYERWPSSGLEADGSLDVEVITKWGHKA